MPIFTNARPNATRPYFGRPVETPDSAPIAAIRYDWRTYTLDVTFKNGSRYRYEHVSSLLFAQFITAKSRGRFLNKVLKKHSHGKKVHR